MTPTNTSFARNADMVFKYAQLTQPNQMNNPQPISPEEQFRIDNETCEANLEQMKKEGTKAWAGKNAQEWINIIRNR